MTFTPVLLLPEFKKKKKKEKNASVRQPELTYGSV